MWTRALKGWVEPYPPRDLRERRQLELLAFLNGLALLGTLAASLRAWGQERPGATLLLAALTLILLGLPALTGRLHSTVASRQIFLGAAALSVWTSTLLGGGFQNPGWIWALAPILGAALLGNRSTLRLYTGLSLVYLWALAMARPGVVGPTDVLGATAAGCGLAASAWVLLRRVEDHLQDATETRTQLAEEKEARAGAERETQAAAEAKSRFLAVMSHELRTPMNGVLGLSELLLEEPLSPAARAHAETLRGSARGLRGILDDIRDFSNLEGQKILLDPHPTALGRIGQEVLDLAEHGPKRVGVDLRFDPCPPETLGVRLDDVRLRQILTHLIDNAVKFTSEGWVRLGVEVHRGRLRFEVEDTGPGIPRDRLPELFQPFAYEEAWATRSHGGAGLGLSITQRLVEAMGGSIGVQSTPGRGSTFWFELPLERCSPPPRLRPDTGPVVLPGEGPVLIVDDNHVNRLVAMKLLTRIGLDTETVESGAAAIARVASGGVRAVLMDVQMPEMDGFEATRRIRAEEKHEGRRRVPILGFSANVLPKDIQDGRLAGMDGYLAKPAERERLVATLTEVLKQQGGAR